MFTCLQEVACDEGEGGGKRKIEIVVCFVCWKDESKKKGRKKRARKKKIFG